MRNFHFPGRSPVYARRAMCATSHPLASLTAIDILEQGGNAVDAAIATAAVLAVVECPMTGIGGDCFALVAKPGTPIVALNAAGRAPQAATATWYAERGIRHIEQASPHAVTVPGAVAGWCRLLQDYGSMPLDRLLAPAIALAEDGFAVTPRVAFDWARNARKLTSHPGARQNLLKDGRPPRVGEVMRFPALARTLKLIANRGRDGFYLGEVADDMVAELRALDGLHTREDFAGQSATYVEPIGATYGEIDLYELPPSNQGITALILLKMLRKIGKPHADPVSAERYHLMLEAARLAYGVRDALVADPEMADVPIGRMLSDSFIDDLVARIEPRRRRQAGPLPRPEGSDTVCFSIVDEDGMAVSFINSLYADFGSGIVTRRTGVTFHNRGQGFVLDPEHPNAIAPGKRPLHTLMPAMVLKNDLPYISFGVSGASFQPLGQSYVLTNMLDYGMDPQEALDCPRVFFEGDKVLVEQSVPAAVIEGLRARGHDVAVRELPFGGGQMVVIDREAGVLIGASDPRKDGLALGY
jgi:gamma-glutamyltranspeptidase/glutathione hydrolase